MKKMLVVLAMMVLSISGGGSVAAQDDHMCPHHEATIAALTECVLHAYEMGHIDNYGVARSLLFLLRSTQTALDRDQIDVAVKNLEVFIRLAEAQDGVHILDGHAMHLIEHAQMVIDALLQ